MNFINLEILTSGGGIMKKNIFQFIKQNGFLLILFTCVCLVAAGTIYIATRDLGIAKDDGIDDQLMILDNDEEEDIKEVSQEDNIDEVDENAEGEEIDNKDEEVVEADEDLDKEDDGSVAVNADIEFVEDLPEEEDVELVRSTAKAILPVEGKVITEHSDDGLIYSETLDDWRKHDGIDIQAALGTDVKAPLDGIIKEVREDDLWGIVIVIDHGNGLETLFANLATKEMVKEGIEVRQGDIISKVGNTAKIELMMEPHIHYEVRKNGEIIDPRSMK